MEAVIPQEVVTLVSIALSHPSQEGESMLMTFVFDRQPQIDDIIQAYATDNFLNKHPHFNDYGPVLSQCLKTYGVPQMYQMNIQTADGWQMQTPMVTARWSANLMGPKESVHNHEFGFIRVYTKPINIAKREEIVEQTKVKRTRAISSRADFAPSTPTEMQAQIKRARSATKPRSQK